MPEPVTWTTELFEARPGVTGIPVPPEVLAAIGAGKRPALVVTVGALTYRTTVGTMGGQQLLALNKERRAEAAVDVGVPLEITAVLDEAPREVEVPADLAAALDAAGRRAAFDALAPSRRKAAVDGVLGAKAEATRARRVAAVVDGLAG
ncbi:YdeI/OmpD-associated family protein [Cellulomonas endophytica]|uniref:YdeI/OmpD-associated family protein n=1 Tax=Cellulomonas endophytica TaxID=2494735 RepID=UPI0010137227|nr:YdeI/OmpD-associated family protein [Cellulomonas endophytica]